MSSCAHRVSYKLDHSIVELNINIANFQGGPCYFKLNNSFLLDKQFQKIVKKRIREITSINENANPNTLWKLVKGSIRKSRLNMVKGEKKKKK